MIIVDLSVERARRAEIERLALQVSESVADFIVSEALRQADRAFAVSGPIANKDVELARIVNRGVLRKLSATIRKRVSPLATADQVRSIVENARGIFTGRLLFLADERDAGRAK